MPKQKPQKIAPALRDEICRLFAETHNASEVSRATGVSDYRVRRVWNSLTIDERERYSSVAQVAVQRVAETVMERQADEVAAYAESLLRVRGKALDVLERMLDALPIGDPECFPLLKDIGKLLRDLHELADPTDTRKHGASEDFYRLLKSTATINIQNNYYEKRETEPSDSGNRSGRVG